MKKLVMLAMLVIATLVGACADRVDVEVRTLQALPLPLRGKTFTMVPYKDQTGSLEWQHYAAMVSGKLAANGLVPVDRSRSPDFGVFINYATTDGQTSTRSVPVYGQTSTGGTSVTSGYVGRAAVSASTYTPPTFGVVGMSTESSTAYGRGIRVVILDVERTQATGKAATVYDTLAMSTGRSSNLMEVMPYIINAVFTEWPAPNGSTIKRTEPFP